MGAGRGAFCQRVSQQYPLAPCASHRLWPATAALPPSGLPTPGRPEAGAHLLLERRAQEAASKSAARLRLREERRGVPPAESAPCCLRVAAAWRHGSPPQALPTSRPPAQCSSAEVAPPRLPLSSDRLLAGLGEALVAAAGPSAASRAHPASQETASELAVEQLERVRLKRSLDGRQEEAACAGRVRGGGEWGQPGSGLDRRFAAADRGGGTEGQASRCQQPGSSKPAAMNAKVRASVALSWGAR